MTIRGLSFLIVALLASGGCERQAQTPTEAALEQAQGPSGERVAAQSERALECLEAVWAVREQAEDFGGETERRFDRDHDAAEGGAISCALATSASQFDKTLTALRDGATNADRAQLLAQAGIPLLHIDTDGEVARMEAEDKLEDAFDRVFTAETLRNLRSIELDEMTVVPDKGAFFDLGALWLVVPERGARPQLVTVNDQAAAEATVAKARAEAEAMKAAEKE